MDRLPVASPESLAGRHGALMASILSAVARVAVSDLSVRLVGEPGVGKEWLARVIHALSARADRPFVHVDCASLPRWNAERALFGSESEGDGERVVRPGLLERSRGGTIYFDAIQRLPYHVRQRLLAAFERAHFRRVGGEEDVHVNVRAIEGVTLEADEPGGRAPLTASASLRLGQVCINLPPLRERKEEIPLLAEHFLQERPRSGDAPQWGFTPEALALMDSYDWPGNVGELRDAVEEAASTAGTGPVGRDHLPPALRRHAVDGARRRSSARLARRYGDAMSAG